MEKIISVDGFEEEGVLWVVEGDIGVVIERGGLDMIIGLDEEGLIDNVSKEAGLKMFMELVGGEMVKEVEEKIISVDGFEEEGVLWVVEGDIRAGIVTGKQIGRAHV